METWLCPGTLFHCPVKYFALVLTVHSASAFLHNEKLLTQRCEAQTVQQTFLFSSENSLVTQFTRNSGNIINMEEFLSVLCKRIKAMVPIRGP